MSSPGLLSGADSFDHLQDLQYTRYIKVLTPPWSQESDLSQISKLNYKQTLNSLLCLELVAGLFPLILYFTPTSSCSL